MKKNLIIRSAILTCLISMFTSCVQSDLYDLYDEDGFFIPRGKKSKDYGGGTYTPQTLPSYSLYPLMYEPTFFDFECGATAVYNETGCSMVEARLAIINSQYGGFNGNSYGLYFLSVTGSAKSCVPSGKDLLNSLNSLYPNGWEGVGVQQAIDYYKDNGKNAFLAKCPAVIRNGEDTIPGHAAVVSSISESPSGNNKKIITFTCIDQTAGGTNFPVEVKSDSYKVVRSAIDVLIWTK